MFDPALDDVLIHPVLSQYRAEKGESTPKLARVDPVRPVGLPDRLACVGMGSTQVGAGQFEFLVSDALEIFVGEEETDDHVAGDALHEVLQGGTQRSFTDSVVVSQRRVSRL